MLVLTSGDPHSVTVEILAPLLAATSTASYLRQGPVVVIGSAWQWQDQAQRLGLTLPAMESVTTLAAARAGKLAFLDVGTPDDSRPAETLAPAARGALAVRCLERLKTETAGRAATAPLAVVTAPIDKHACQSAGYAFPGQTEFFENLWGSAAVMTLAGPRLRVGLVTNHLALRDVPGRLSQDLIRRKLALFARTLRESFRIARPRIAVAGLNPHASDQGLFGDEEARLLTPAIAAVREAEALEFRADGAEIVGPLPADTVFYRALHGSYDGVLAMYHDQGLGPLKTVHFDDAVNLSGGLRHFRASPDHGPAKDLFLARRASPKSFAAALDLAVNYLERGAGGKA